MRTPEPRVSALLAIGLLVLSGLACSYLRPKPKLTWHLTLQLDAVADRAAATKQAIVIIERRLSAAGVSNFEVKPDGDPGNGRILVNLPTTKDPERLAQLITVQGKLELVAVVSPPSPAPVQTYITKEEAVTSLNSDGTILTNRRVLPYAERAEISDTAQPSTKKWVVVETPAIVDGRELRDASASRSRGGDYEIEFSLNKNGAEKFGAWTGSHINQYLGIVLNDEVKSIPFIKSQIFDQGEITGRFTKQSAEDLAVVLKSGSLPGRVVVIDEKIDPAK
jgi:protein-export membrane protein SecD